MNQRIKALASYIVILLDIGVMLAAYSIANILRFNTPRVRHIVSDADYAALLWFVILAYIAVQIFFRTNTDFLTRDKVKEAFLVLKQYIIVSLCVMTYFYIMKLGEDFSRLQLGYFFILSVSGTYIEHLLFKKAFRIKYMTTYAEKIILITDSCHAGNILDELKKITYLSIEYIALIDKNMSGRNINGVPVAASMDNMEEVLKKIPVDGAFIHIPYSSSETAGQIMGWLEEMGIQIHLNLWEYEYDFGKKQFTTIGKYGVLTYSNYEYDMRDVVIKRIMDICSGAVLFLCMCIVFPFVAAGIVLQSPGPVLFKQTRIGRNGRRFEIYKFRSMYMDAEEKKEALMKENEMCSDFIFKIKDDPRIFPVGKLIRKLSIDELPQAINILKGEMSLVGTRPPTESEFEMYNSYHRRRVSIKPGLTGLWQVSGRSSITDFDEIVRLDCEYIDNWNLRLDFKIIVRTIWVVLFGKGAE